MKNIMERMEKNLEKKSLELNVGKTKVVRFREGRGRMSKMDWWRRGKKIEEVKKFYLGYTLQRNRGQEAHVKERIAKAATVGQIWGNGKRRFGRNWKTRIWLYDTSVRTVMGYDVEVWGWKERESIERVHEKFLRWILGIKKRTLEYLVREEMQREMMRGRAGRRAWGMKKKLEEGKGSKTA